MLGPDNFFVGKNKGQDADDESANRPEPSKLERSGRIRNLDGSNSASKKGRVSFHEIADLEDELQKKIFSTATAEYQLADEELALLSSLMPRLRSAGRFWDAVGGIRPNQLAYFKEEILSSLEQLDNEGGDFSNPEFINGYMVANRLGGAEVGSIALDQLPISNQTL